MSDVKSEPGISVNEREKFIDITWPDHQEASSHVLRIVDGKKVYSRLVTEAKYSINKREFSLQNGNIFPIRVTVLRLDASIINCYDTECVVGGDEVPTGFLARFHAGYPNAIEVQWNRPRRTPIQYEVALWQKADNAVISTMLVKGLTGMFVGLNEKTTYFCTIKAIYDSNESGKIVRSEDVQTSAAPPSRPMPKNVTCQLDPNSPSRRIIAKWDAPVAKDVKKYECYLIPTRSDEVLLWGETFPKRREDNVMYLKETSSTSISFSHLKSARSYRVGIKATYLDGTASEETYSPAVHTARRLDDPREKLDDFGKPDKIFHDIREKQPNNIGIDIALSWTPVKLNTNFKLLGYTVSLFNLKMWHLMKRRGFASKFGPEVFSVNIDGLEHGERYRAQILTKFRDLDTDELLKKTKTYHFQLNLNVPKIHDCTVEGGIIRFQWDSVAGAVAYTLIVKQLRTDDQLHFSMDGAHVCYRNIPTSLALGIGKVCRVKVIVTRENGQQSEIDWSIQVIGGGYVPRNIKAVPWRHDPSQAIRVTWDPPQKGVPDSYKIVARPDLGGEEREITCRDYGILFERLTPGSKYTFEVHAMYGDVATDPSISNKCRTKQAPEAEEPMMTPKDQDDSGVGTVGTRSTSTRRSKKSRMDVTTFKGSQPDEGASTSLEKTSSKYDPDFLKLQKKQMKEYGLNVKEKRSVKLNKWLCLKSYDAIASVDVDMSVRQKRADSGKTNICVGKLDMSNFHPTEETLNIFLQCLLATDIRVSELDMSQNPELNLESVAKIIETSSVRRLSLRSCTLNLEKMKGLKKALTARKLDQLDLSGNQEIGSNGMAVLGDIASQYNVESMLLQDCNLERDHIVQLRSHLKKSMVTEIDLSGNLSLRKGNGIAEIGRLVQTATSTSLRLQNCDIDGRYLSALRESLSHSKLTKLDLSGNSKIDSRGMTKLGLLVKKTKTSRLVLRDCRLTPSLMTALKQSLGDFKLTELDISIKKAPAQTLSGLESASSDEDAEDQSDEESVDEETSKSNQSVEDPQPSPKDATLETPTFNITEIQEAVAEFEPPKAELLETHQSQIQDSNFPQDDSNFQPEELILNLLTNVQESIRMENWIIEKKGQDILVDEIRRKNLHGLKVTTGSSVISIGRQDSSPAKKVTSRKKVSWEPDPPQIGRSQEEAGTVDKPSGGISQEVDIWEENVTELAGVEKGLATEVNMDEDQSETQAITSPNPKELESESRDLSVSKMIGPKGGTVQLFGCKLKFPAGALLEETSIELAIESNLQQIPEHFIAVTPVLKCKPSMTFQKLVSVEMRTCFSAPDGKEVPVTILYKKQKMLEWKKLTEVKLREKNVIHFELAHFCLEVGVVAEGSSVDGYCHLHHDIYINRESGLIMCVFCKDEYIQEKKRRELKRKNFVEAALGTEEAVFTVGDEVRLQMECVSPPNLDIASFSSSFKITTIFMKRRECHQIYFEPKLGDDYRGKVSMNFKLPVGSEGEKSLPLRFDWPIKDVPGDNEKTSDVEVNVNLNKSQSGNFVASGQAKIETTVENSSLRSNQ